jgi:mycothiol synthase
MLVIDLLLPTTKRQLISINQLQHLNHLSQSQQVSVLELIKAATDFDGVPPIAEHVLLHLRHGGDKADSHLVIEKNGHVIAYAHLDKTDLVAGPSVEAVVHPKYRNRGLGTTLLKEAITKCGSKTRIWSHGDLPQAKKIATSLKLERIWANLQMSKQLLEIEKVTSNFLIRNFLPGIDDQALLELNNKVFTDHPDQGSWSIGDLRMRVNEEWFDEKGFFVCEDKGRLFGFCWTKVHGLPIHSLGDDKTDYGQEATGEIYVLAVDPEYKRRGVGKDLINTGLNYLKYQGIGCALLYVGVDNKSALNFYRSLGFQESGIDFIYRKNPKSS